jgi:hypothetical protein
MMARKAVAEMIALQRRIFKRQRRLIESSEIHQTAGFVRYRNEYRRAVDSYLHEAGFGAMCDAIAAARVAYVADYHTLRLAQKTLLTILRAAMHQVDNISLAVEFVDQRYQEELDRFLEGRISETTFLGRIRYREHWPYDIWPNFKPIFELAAEQGFPVIAIDSDAGLPLARRDTVAARIIADLARRHPASTIVVSAGQMHMAPSHLPAKVDLAFIAAGLEAPERVIVYQNAEEIYWQLAQEGREEAEVVLVAPGEYCVNNTPPLVQQLSYLHWVHFDEDLIEYTQAEQTVRSLISDLARYLKLDAGDAAQRVRVMVPGDLDLIDVLEDAELPEGARRQILLQAEAQESACIPALELIYLATLSVNHAAEEATHYLRHVISGGEEPAGAADRFYFTALNEACAFFGSKVINPKRKADHPGRLRTMLAGARRRKRMEPEDHAAEFALAHLAWERSDMEGRAPLRGAHNLADPTVFNAAAHFLGYIMGDRLYYGLTDGVVPKALIRELFVADLAAEGVATRRYIELSRQLLAVKIPRRI